MSSLSIVFEDEHILVVNKPAGVLSQPGKTVDGSIATLAKEAYPQATGPMLVHRLDMDTSGLMVLAKAKSGHRHLQQQFEHRKVSKVYVAILCRSPIGQGGRIQLPLRLDIDNRPSQIVCYEYGKRADTLWYQTDSSINANGVRVIFKPITGRTHQLRVHAAHKNGLNAAIVGDRLYGIEGERLMLHAQALSFNHPDSQERVAFYAPADF